MQINKGTKVSSTMAWSMARANTIISKGSFILEIGMKIRNMGKDYIFIKMEPGIMEILKTIWNMAKVR